MDNTSDNSGSSLLDQLSNIATTGAQVYGAVTGQHPAASTTTAAAPAKTNWLLIGGIGAAVLLILALLLRK